MKYDTCIDALDIISYAKLALQDNLFLTTKQTHCDHGSLEIYKSFTIDYQKHNSRIILRDNLLTRATLVAENLLQNEIESTINRVKRDIDGFIHIAMGYNQDPSVFITMEHPTIESYKEKVLLINKTVKGIVGPKVEPLH